jgi:hypothetical protein
VNHTGEEVIFEGIGDGPVTRDLAAKILRYFTLPSLPTVGVRLAGGTYTAADYANFERLDFWGKDPVKTIAPFESHGRWR